jgi:hypothetical protein
MKISKFVAALALCAVCAAPMPANAQFLKKLGDALSKADKALSKKSDKSKSQMDNLVDMPGVTLEVLDVYHDGLGAKVDFRISNSSQNVYDITFNGTDGLDGWAKSQAVGADGQARKCYVPVIGDHEGLDMVTRHRLMPGTTSLGSFKISNLSRDIKSLNNFSIAGLWQANEDNNNHNFNFIFNGPVAISTPENTNAANVYCTIPTLNVSLDKVERDKGMVMYYLTLTNSGKETLKYQPNSGYVKDLNGQDHYRFGMMVNGKELGNYDYVTFDPGSPVSAVFAVPGVADTVSAMDDVIWMFRKPEYFISIRDQEISTAGTSAAQSSTKATTPGTVTGVRKGANLVATLRQFKSITWDYNADFGVIANVPGMWIVVDEADLTPEGQKVINALTSDMENGICFSIDYIKPTAKVGEFEKN